MKYKYKSGKLAVVKNSQVMSKIEDGWLVKPSKSGKMYTATPVTESPFSSQKRAWDFIKESLRPDATCTGMSTELSK